MVAKDILKADFLDILFDNRNKKYGAYELRKTYRERLLKAVLTTLFFGGLLLWLVKPVTGDELYNARMMVREVVLQDIEEIKPPPPPPPETAKPVPPEVPEAAPVKPKMVEPKVATTKFTPPVIKKDKDVKKSEMPPVEEIAQVAVVTTAGAKDKGFLTSLPPVKAAASLDKGTGIIAKANPKKVDENKIFEKVEIQASVNLAQWRRHLERNLLRYIEDAAYSGMAPGTYTVNVRFLVEKDGRISSAKALNNPGYGLSKGAVEVVKRGPKWTPGEQNGRKVRSYHTQPITFVIQEM